MRRRNRASDFGGSGLVDGDSWRAMLEDDASSHEIVGAVRVVEATQQLGSAGKSLGA